ncbi:unnamed protein product [Rotaria sp. Silwood2]|nr:unnamed protein product [Rotaria sp. Silwood2]
MNITILLIDIRRTDIQIDKHLTYLIIEVNCQICFGASQYESCSIHNQCGCLQITSNNGHGNICQKPDHICVHHPHCHHYPLCYPLEIAKKICPVAASTGEPGNDSNQLNNPQDIFVDNNETIYITDTMNGRVQMWFKGDLNGTTIVENIDSIGIVVDTEESIYITDWLKGQLTK